MRRLISLAVASAVLLPSLVSAGPVQDLFLPPAPLEGESQRYIVLLQDGVKPIDLIKEIIKKDPSAKSINQFTKALNGMTMELNDAQLIALRKDVRVEGVWEDKEVTIALSQRWQDWLNNRRKSSSSSSKSSASSSRSSAVSSSSSSKSSSSVSSSVSSSSMPSSAPSNQVLPFGVDRIDGENQANKGAGVEVAVMDTGIDLDHPDLQANIAGGVNCVGGTSYNDVHGHGTHVAGTIAARDNGAGVVGVAPEAKLWAVKVLDDSGRGTWSSLICGLDYVASHADRIKVANLSLGGAGSDGSCDSDPLHQAVCRVMQAGVTLVVAAGNEGKDMAAQVPATFSEVLTVTALADSDGRACSLGAKTSYGADDTFASFSNYATQSGDKSHTIGAPGVAIRSTWKDGQYALNSGTSMASPHVAGAAALYVANNPGASPSQVRQALMSNAETPGTASCGTGYVTSGTHAEGLVRAAGL